MSVFGMLLEPMTLRTTDPSDCCLFGPVTRPQGDMAGPFADGTVSSALRDVDVGLVYKEIINALQGRHGSPRVTKNKEVSKGDKM